jgi:hypothetical protein
MPGLEIEEAAAILKILPALNRSCAAQTVNSQGFTGEVTPLSGAQKECRIRTERCCELCRAFYWRLKLWPDTAVR